MKKEYIKVLKKDIEEFFEDMLIEKIITKDDLGEFWLEHYHIESYFIDNYILNKNLSISDYYLGEDNPVLLGDKQDSIDSIQKWVVGEIKNRLEEYIELVKA